MRNLLKLIGVGVLFLGLVAVRLFETTLFYDPLIHFYEADYQTEPPPVLDEWKLFLHTTFRYMLNAALSLLVLFVAFQSRKVMRFSFWFYAIVFVVLMLLFAYFIFNMAPENYFTLFYVRRFLIQPIFIILLLPAFYYQKTKRY